MASTGRLVSHAKTRACAFRRPYVRQIDERKRSRMAPDAEFANARKGNAGTSETGGCEAAVSAQSQQRFLIRVALSVRGLEIESLAASELGELEELAAQRVERILDEIVERWQDARTEISERARIDRELRRRIVAEKEESDSRYECEGCSFRHYDHCAFLEFRGLFLCDGCAERARGELRELQRPLIDVLETEPTVENARALGFELSRKNGRLVWVGDEDTYDGGDFPYADAHEALEDLVGELA
jgi:hypothetical protein